MSSTIQHVECKLIPVIDDTEVNVQLSYLLYGSLMNLLNGLPVAGVSFLDVDY